MAKSYQTCPRSSWMDEDRLHPPSIDVFETANEWRETGLLDARGQKIMSRDAKGPLGFIQFSEKA